MCSGHVPYLIRVLVRRSTPLRNFCCSTSIGSVNLSLEIPRFLSPPKDQMAPLIPVSLSHGIIRIGSLA